MQKRKYSPQILLVLENPLDLKTIELTLNKAGYSVKATNCAKKGLEIAGETNLDILITSIKLIESKASGKTFWDSFKIVSNKSPIIIISGKEKCKNLNSWNFDYETDDLIVTPFKINEVKLRVEIALRKKLKIKEAC